MTQVRRMVYLAALAVCICTMAMAQPRVNKVSSDQFEIVYPEKNKQSLVVLQVTDLHLGNRRGSNKDMLTLRRIEKLVKLYQPDMIAITGDLFTGEKPNPGVLAMLAVEYFDQFKIPYFYVFGNHDPQGNSGREPFRKVFNASRYGMLGYHQVASCSVKHDFRLSIKLGDSTVPAWEFYAFDSGSEPGTRSIGVEQLDWYRQLSEQSKKANGPVRAAAFFHIPFKQYESLWQDSTITKVGWGYEKVCYEEDDGSAYDAFVEQGNILACFCGHDHDNNYSGVYHGGILLVYGHVSGEAGYHRHWPPGGKVLTFPRTGKEIGLKNVLAEIDWTFPE